jgi:hypothetical protein
MERWEMNPLQKVYMSAVKDRILILTGSFGILTTAKPTSFKRIQEVDNVCPRNPAVVSPFYLTYPHNRSRWFLHYDKTNRGPIPNLMIPQGQADCCWSWLGYHLFGALLR